MANWNVRPSTGTGQMYVSATTISQNNTYSAKTATITITDGSATKYVKLRQGPIPHLETTNGGLFQSAQFNSEGGKVYFNIIGDADSIVQFQIAFSGANSSHYVIKNEDTGAIYNWGSNWRAYSLSPNEYSGYTFSLSADTNTGGTQINDTIGMYYWWEDASTGYTGPVFPVTITQNAGAVTNYVLEFNSPSYTIGSGNTSISLPFHYENMRPETFGVYADDDWVINSSLSIDWTTSSVTLSVVANPVGLPRTTSVKIYGSKTDGWSKTGSTQLTQDEGITNLIASPSAMSFGYLQSLEGGAIPYSASVISNTNWNVTQGGGDNYHQWYTISPTTGSGSDVIGIIPTSPLNTFHPISNRVNTITIAGGNASAVITATQYAFPHCEPTLYSTYDVPAAGGDYPFQIVVEPEGVGVTRHYAVRFSGNTANTQWMHIEDANGNIIPMNQGFDADDYSGQYLHLIVDANTGYYRDGSMYLQHYVGIGESVSYWDLNYQDLIFVEQNGD